MRLFCICFFFFSASFVYGQTILSGEVRDQKTGKQLINVELVVFKGNFPIQTALTDLNGRYKLNIKAGTYDVLFSYEGYLELRINDVMLMHKQSTPLNVELSENFFNQICDLNVICFCPPILETDFSTAAKSMDKRDLRKAPVKSIRELAASAAGISFQ